MRTNAYGTNFSIIDTGTVTHTDTVFLRHIFNIDCTVDHSNPLSFLVNQTYACKCPECGYEGLKSKVTEILITSDSVYNGIAAGQSLNGLFKVQLETTGNNIVSIDTFKTQLNGKNYGYAISDFITSQKPGNNLGHKFIIRFSFADGTMLTSNSKTIFWN